MDDKRARTKVIAIFDSDGILIDTHVLVRSIIPESWRSIEKKPLLWNMFRKIVILIKGDRVCDERLMGVNVEAIRKVVEQCDEVFIVTKRPFWFGGKRRLMKQLGAIYGTGMFRPENVFSSCFSQNKGEIIQEKIIHGRLNVYGIFVDDNENNLHWVPLNIRPVWFNPDGQTKVVYGGQCEVNKMGQIPLLLNMLYGGILHKTNSN